MSLARDDLAGARKLLDDAGEHVAGRHQLPGEPHLNVVTALIRARTVLADGDSTGARGLVLRLRDTSAPDDPHLDWMLTLLDCGIALRTGDTRRARITLDSQADGPYHDRADRQLMPGSLCPEPPGQRAERAERRVGSARLDRAVAKMLGPHPGIRYFELPVTHADA